jgi:F0F1-type ATP synthase membrane subunit b/b'
MATTNLIEYERQVAAIIEQALSEMINTDLTAAQIIKGAREHAERKKNDATTQL